MHKLVKLIYMKNCVNTSHKEFKELARKLDIDDSSLELIIYKFQNADPNNVNVFPSEEYIRSKLTGVNYASSKAQKELWKKVYNKDFKFNSSEELNKAIETAKKYFNSEAITVWKNREGNYVMRVADPENIKEDLYEKELQDILAKAPRDKEGRLLAPNGKLSNLTERQYAQVRTKAFKEWFGDWKNDPQNASKVIDENGEPLVVYHGSPIVTIDKFDLENSIGLQLRDNEGFTIGNTAWFTPQERIAKNTYSVKPESLGKGEAAVEYGKVYPVFLNIRTPLVDGLKNAQEHLEWWGNYVTADEKVQDFIKRVYQRANKENTDGFILTFEDIDQDTPSYHSLQTQFGIVNANQVKSADANIGSFSKEDDNIFFNKDVSTIYDLLQYLHTKLHYSTKKSGVTEVKRIITKLHDVYYVSKFDSEKALEDLEKYREKYLLPKGIFKVKSLGKNKIISVDTEVLKDAIERNQNNQNFGDLFSSAEEAIRVREVLDFLSAKTGLKYTTISESEAIKLLNKSKKKLGSTNAFIHNNVCYFIQGRKLNVDIASEEMLHPFINAMYNQNRMLFDNLLKEAMIRFPKLRLEIAESYKEDSEDVRYQELVTQALSRAFREERTNNPAGNSISNIIKYFLDFVKDLFSAGNKDYILLDELKADITLEDLSKIINTELKLLYNSNFGDITRFSKNKKDTIESENSTINTEQLNKSKNLVAKIISDSKENIKKHPNFDKEDVEGSHTYLIKQSNDWIPADSSVTQLVHGNINLGGWRLPSMKLGNTTDRFVRRYFELPKDKKDKILKEYFPNLTKEQALALKEDLDKLSAHFEEKFNGNWGVETREFPIAGKYAVEEDGKLVYKTVAGTMDMLVYDGEGNFYIYDFKTVRSNLNNQKLEGYYQQLSIYKAILEANYPELKGKIKEMDLIRFSLYYETPIKENGTMEYEVGEEDEDKDILLVYDESIDDKHYIPIENTKWYKAPRLYIGRGKNSGVHKAFYSVPEITLSQQFKSLTEEEKLFSEEFKKEINENYPNIDEINIQVDSLYNNPLLTATERMFLANTVMYYTSNIITHLQSDPRANSTYLGDSYSRYDFTLMSRQEIIETVGINNIFKYIKEAYFNSSVRDDIEDWDLLNKLDIAYNNWEALTRSAYSKLITLEGVTVTRTAPEYITKEGIEDSLMESQDTGALEENEREYWQLGIRHISTKSSLSNEVRRVFERLVVTDQNGDPILDKYGYNFHTFVDSNEAVNKILDWCQDCTTIEEMEESIRNMAESNPWVNGILEKLQEEPFRSQFFQNFRKDFTQYSIITVDTDSKGNRVYKVLNINTKGASKVILDGVTTAYKEGLLTNIIIPIKGDIEGRGKVNVKEVESLGKSVKSVSKKLHSSFGTTNFNKTLNSQIPEVVKILNKLGVSINIQTLKDAFSKDGKFKNEPNTTYFKVLSNIGYLLDTLLENKGNNEYNPLEKGGEGNIYGNYKNIVTVLSKYIQDSVEASTYENGKMHYSFVTPSYMGKLITNLKDALGNEVKFKKFMQEEYKQYRWFYDGQWNNEWLRLLNTSGEMRQKLEHKVQLSFDGTPYNELSELGYTLSLMHEYFYDNAGKKNLAWYRVPILANKPSSEFIRFKRYSGSRYQRDIINGLSMVANQEIMRIKTVLERSQNPNIQKIGVKEKATYDIKDGILNSSLNKKIQKRTLTFNDIIKNGQSIFKGSGAEFKFLPALNQEILNKTTLGQLILDKINGKNVNESLFEKEFNSAIKSYMKTMVAREINNWRQLGLFDTIETKTKVKGKNITNVEYRYLKQFGKTEEEILDALEEYVWNDMFATINIIQLTATDLAYYKNIEDFQKRYAQVHSPALRLNVAAKDSKGNLYSKDGKERTIYLKDFIVESEIIPQVTAVFDNKISKLSGVEKQHMKMMKDLIIESFKKVNVADAQGYSSPTSYRKKMGMAGRWTTDMEEAYQRICKGDFNVNDLGIVWQPLKPFVYSQIPKSTGAQTMNKIKLAVQNKNSEYLLILADALMRGGNQVSKLTAIFDFMEDSAYDGRVSKDGKVIKEGVYNGIGIDTIQFESAVNSGSMGAIDINNLDSYNAIKEQLNRHVYYNSDHSESSDNDMDRYNDQFVHTISFEDYGIQQEVPAHLVDHEQPMGSQIRILSISDITPGTKFNVNGELIDDKKLVKEYQDLIAENIKDSFKQLAKDFNITGTRIEKNIALSKLLVEAIENDQRYGADLRRACSLNPITKEFNIPLNDPIQSIRIQQLINSIIKTRINKQKVPGGPVVQASVFGMSDDLKIVWKDKKKGIVDYFECYMPIPSMELEKALTKYDENGHAYFMSIEEAIKKGIITEEMTKAIGYRIPTEDKYSMAPLKIKGFLPKAAGEAIMLPKEITTLAGSDFDIDKMYIMLKAFKVNKPKADFELIENAFKSYLTSQGKKAKEISNYIYGNKNTGESSIREYISKIESGVSFSITTPKETRVDEKGLAIERWYNANKDRIYTKHSFVEEVSLETREGRTNRIFDLQWAVLTNEDTMDKLFNPGSFEVQKKSARIVNILKHNGKKYTYKELASKKLEDLDSIIENQNDKSIIFSSTQVYFHKQNMTAGKLIGIFANNNTSHAFLSLQDISFNVDNEFMFNGFHVNNEQNNRLDLLRGKDGSLISKTIAGFLAASVDAVKDPVLNYMNLNTFTAGPAMVLARLGFNSDSIGLFLSQPIIESVTREYFKRSNEGYVSINDIIDDFLPEDPKLIKGIKASLSSTPFTMEDMAKGITLGDTSTNFQQSVLVLFKQLSEMAQDLNTLTFITKFNSITNAVGPTIADTLVMRERYEKFIDNMNSDNPPFTINAKYVLENSPILEAFYNTTLSDGGASKLIFQEYFPHYSSMFTQVLQAIRKNTKGNLDSKIINKLVNDFILYKMTIGEDPVLNADESNRKKYMIDFPQYFIQRASNIIDNDLLKIINLKARDYKCPVPTLEAETGGYSIDVQERVKAGWGNLVINPETKELGRDLLYYNIFRSGFNFSPKTFGHLASVDVKLNIPGYVSILQDVEFNDDLFNIENFIYMFLRNHTDSSKLVPELRINKNIEVSYSNNSTGEDVVTISYNDESGINSILTSSEDIPVFAKVISINDDIYMNPIVRLDSVVYTKTTTLGITNNFLEYDGNSSANMSSIFKSKQVIKKEPSKSSPIEEDRKNNYVKLKDVEAVLQKELGLKEYQLYKAQPASERQGFINKIVTLTLQQVNANTKNENLREVVRKKVEDRLKQLNVC